MDRGRLRDRLTDLPLEEDEADLYLALLDVGTSKARRVAEEAGVHRTTAYRILEDLADRDLVEVGVGSPMKFSPAPPERLFRQVRREKTQELDQIEEIESEVADTLEALHQGVGTDAQGDSRWRMIQGRERIVEEAVGVLEDAREELRYLATNPLQGEERGDVDVDWQSAVARKAPEIDTRFLLNPEPVSEDVIEDIKSLQGARIRFTDSSAQAQSCLIDGEVFVWVVMGRGPEDDVALWSNAPDLYTSQRLLFDGLWEGAQVPPKGAEPNATEGTD